MIYDGLVVGVTRVTITVPNDEQLHQITVRKDGYESGTCLILREERNSAVILNLIPGLLWPFIPKAFDELWLISTGGLLIDRITGDMWKPSRNSCTVRLFEHRH